MDNKDYIKGRLEQYLRMRGINPVKPFRCLNPAHEDRHPSMNFHEKRNAVHCFSCGANYDIFSLIGLDYGLDAFSDQLKKAEELFGLNRKTQVKAKKAAPKAHEDFSDYFKQAHKNLSKTDYPARRGISEETAARFMLGYDDNFKTKSAERDVTWKALIIPNGSGYTARNTDESAGERDRIRKRGTGGLFNADIIDVCEEHIFVVEGEFDAMSVYEAGGEAIALGSVSNASAFLALAAERPPKKALLLALDNDDAGRKCLSELSEGLTLACIPFQVVGVAGDKKDASEAIVASRDDFVQSVTDAMLIETRLYEVKRTEYLKNRTLNYIQEFLDGISDSVNTKYIKTGFSKLDEALGGGLFEGLYIIGAITSLGKTSFALQLADQVAADGEDVLIISLEMARTELMSKSVSRLTLQNCTRRRIDTKNAKSARGISTGSRYWHYSETELDVINSAVEEYKKSAENIYIYEGIGDIGVSRLREMVRGHIEYTGKRPLVIIDYLQILAPVNERMTDKQNTDRSVMELKRISRDFKLPVIGISSFNRQSYTQAVTMEAFKESGAIEYSSDVLIGLQLRGAGGRDFDQNAAKRRDPREIELKILKNRNGSAGVEINYSYYPVFNYFEETK